MDDDGVAGVGGQHSLGVPCLADRPLPSWWLDDQKHSARAKREALPESALPTSAEIVVIGTCCCADIVVIGTCCCADIAVISACQPAVAAVPERGLPVASLPLCHLPRFAGAGMTGTATAYHLSQRGLSCIILDARGVAHGATGRNGAECVSCALLFADSFSLCYGA